MTKVYGVSLSPFVRKVLFTLNYKGIPFEQIPTMPGDNAEAFAAISPLHKIPALEHEGFSISDSSIICDYLDRVFPDKPIYPADPQARAKACWLEEFGDSKLAECCGGGLFFQRVVRPNFFKEEPDEALIQDTIDNKLPPALSYLETVVPENGYLVGDHLTIADIGVTTHFINAMYADYQVDSSIYPRLGSYLQRAMSSDLVKTQLEKERAEMPG